MLLRCATGMAETQLIVFYMTKQKKFKGLKSTRISEVTTSQTAVIYIAMKKNDFEGDMNE